ncbi:hypothetical protein Ddye_012884 [Dipteronia dyeriana]|uniref:RNase H type-1 domain-containing protein n=1 Tax=Dipteronia dyeriana TaxID=168575 RepID=A0AAD9X543_9ROSI|nr:hypothetical protein Ddye_012884 [Dipteronia dyeriana]
MIFRVVLIGISLVGRQILFEFNVVIINNRRTTPQFTVNNNIWIPPVPGIFKLNFDAAIDKEKSLVGFDLVIHDSKCLVMATSTQRITANFSPQVAEATAIFCGITFALVSGLSPLRVASDAEVVVNWIKKESKQFSDIGVIITNIISLTKDPR